MQYLKQNTVVDIRIGPAMAIADGVTPVTTLALGTADQAEVLKENGAATVAMGGAFAAVTGCDGWYDYTVAAGDVDTLGHLTLVVQDASLNMPIFKDFMVVPANNYDSLVLGTDNLTTDVVQINGNTTAAINAALSNNSIIVGTAVTGTLDVIKFTTNIGGTYTINDAINGRTLLFTGGTLVGQAQAISSYTATGGEITVAGPFTGIPANTDPFIIL